MDAWSNTPEKKRCCGRAVWVTRPATASPCSQPRLPRDVPKCLAPLRTQASALGITLAGAVNLVDPEKIVLGGAYAELAAWLTPGMQQELGSRVRIRPWNPAGLAISALRREGPVVGAATSVVQRVIGDPSSLRP